MCGIVGRVNFDGVAVNSRWLHAACDLLAHRGPDGERVLIEGDGTGPTVALGHRRLKVIDLRPLADQPMQNDGCRPGHPDLAIVFNGEIYNYRDLRRELEARGHRFTTDSDTEVVLHLYEDRGARCVEALRGMFAFAIWDRSRRQVMLARDRVGKKPMYYRHDGSHLWFASEARAILADPDVPDGVDPQAIRTYLTLGYVPGADSVFAALRRLPPAHYALIDAAGARVTRYWTLEYEPKFAVSEGEAIDEIRRHLAESVRLRLISDVPLGAFLSGGIDSSAVVALMSQAGGRTKTFSIGFDDDRYSEIEHARTVAARFGTDHHEFVVSPDVASILPKLAWHYGEPFADSSAVPTYHLARLAREHITVALTGDGGDESFAGYRRYVAEGIAERVASLPVSVRRLSAALINWLPPAKESRSGLYDVRRLIAGLDRPRPERYASYFGFFDPAAAVIDRGFAAETSAARALEPIARAFEAHASLDPAEAAMAFDVSSYLPDDLLVKADVATMAHGLEARSPLLDHHVMSLAARLPLQMKLAGRRTKSLFKRSLAGVVPGEILSRPKMGFGVPLDRWLRTSLRDLVHDTLLGARARQLGYLSPEGVRQLVDEHMSGSISHGHRLWALLMLHMWRDHALEPSRAARAATASDSDDVRPADAARLPVLPLHSRPGSSR
jgi:asparagine synthase (glutamine-hydrolysing)